MIKYFKLYGTDYYVVGLMMMSGLIQGKGLNSIFGYLSVLFLGLVGYIACIIYNAIYRHRKKP